MATVVYSKRALDHIERAFGDLCQRLSDSHPTEILLDLASITGKQNIRTAQTKYVPLLPWPNSAQPFDGAAFGIARVSFACKSSLVKVGVDGTSLRRRQERMA